MEAVREIAKKRSQAIRGVQGRISGHSLRVGSAVSLARGNVSLVEMQVDGRWKDSRMPSHSASAELAEPGPVPKFFYGTGKGILAMKRYQMRWAQKYWGKESSDLIICQLGMDTNNAAPLVGKTNGAASHSWGGGSPKKI